MDVHRRGAAPRRPGAARAVVLSLLDQPWEQAPTSEHATLAAPFGAVREALEVLLGQATPALVTR